MSNKEVIYYKGKRYTKYTNTNYYWHHGKWKEPPISLHNQVWMDNHGKIPKGHIIHHKDGNPENNGIDNLECITEREHKRIHYSDKEWSDRMRKALSDGQLKRPMVEYTCKNCGKTFQSRRTHNVFFCSKHCGQRWRLEHGDFLTEYERVCKKCGTAFNTPSWHRKLCYNCYKKRSDIIWQK